jgi:hypothetical protein
MGLLGWCGMLAAAGLARSWPHDLAHQFFSRARWSADHLGLAVAQLVVALLVPAGQPVTVAIDDTRSAAAARRSGPRRGFTMGRRRGLRKRATGTTGWSRPSCSGCPMISRLVAVPVLAKLVIKDATSASRLWLARRMAQMIAPGADGRAIRVVAAAAHAGKDLKTLPPGITGTTRLRKDAALYDLPPERTGRHGRPTPKVPGYSVFGSRPVQVVLIRDASATG